ncbi:MAG: hypothetical protein EBW84_13165, partial [Betaproteobacteria bacterium]|nr:hypothetical protein [Betaproteobacteria bacterium]
MPELVLKNPLLDGKLRVRIDVLHAASATNPKVAATRLDTPALIERMRFGSFEPQAGALLDDARTG